MAGSIEEDAFNLASLSLVRCLFEGDGDGAAIAFAEILAARRIQISDGALLRITAAARGARQKDHGEPAE